jgi:phytoene dehydrogenase-like protein
MIYDVVIVGGGIAGLTAAAYLSKSGYHTLVCEKEEKLGGLVNSFSYHGFTFDGGIRSIENSGIVFPMLRQLGLSIDFVKSNVSIGLEHEVVNLTSEASLLDYQSLLLRQFPDNANEIKKIIADVKRIMGYMDVLYGIDNPLFLDLQKDKEYFVKTILPWLFKYIMTIRKIQKLNTPVDEYLRNITANQDLIDMIAQHFFQKTPTFFALSYFRLYLDYHYPKGGTGVLIDKLEQFILDHQGEIRKDTRICSVQPQQRLVADQSSNSFKYRKLIWAADLKELYQMIDVSTLTSNLVRKKVLRQKIAVSDKRGGDSVFTLFLTVNLDKSFFENICTAHFFYTPCKKGLHHVDISLLRSQTGKPERWTQDKAAIIEWLRHYFQLTTYEVSFPVMRDSSLAPPGKTGLILSTLFEYSLAAHISNLGWYDEFKEICAEAIIGILDSTIFPGLKSNVVDHFSSTPLTLNKLTGNSDGAITGWSFTNAFIPAVSSLPQIARSVLTPVPDVLQAGQWTFSPSGLPISILTGKLAADRAKKQLK